MAEIGHNQPPGMIESAAETLKDISAWLAERPIITGEADAREAKLMADRGKLAIKDLEDERKAQTVPLDRQLEEINARYRGPKNSLKSILDILSSRLTVFLQEEERKRIEAANQARRLAAEAEAKAREAERLEKEAMDAAAVGELDIDIGRVSATADAAFADYKKADRQAVIAERDTHVKLGRGLTGRSGSLRSVEILKVVDAAAAVRAMDGHEEIIEIIRKAAKQYRKVFGELPPGIESHWEQEYR